MIVEATQVGDLDIKTRSGTWTNVRVFKQVTRGYH